MNKPYLPQSLLTQLSPFPHIKKMIISNWGTMFLQHYFIELMIDTRNGDRKGFPDATTKIIFELSLINTKYLETIGLSEPIDEMTLIQPSWTLPKNF